MRAFLLLLILMSGCASTKLNDISQYLTKEQAAICGNTVDDIKKYYFTDEAYEAIKDIPVEIGFASGAAYAAGTTPLSSIGQFITGHGFGRKIIVSESRLHKDIYQLLIHEFTHHLDDMTRDGEANFISLEEFLEAYKNCFGHRVYHGIVLFVEREANKPFTNIFGMGEYAEHIAYTSMIIANQGCPPDLSFAFRKILRKYSGTGE